MLFTDAEPDLPPDDGHIEWHAREVFRAPAMA